MRIEAIVCHGFFQEKENPAGGRQSAATKRCTADTGPPLRRRGSGCREIVKPLKNASPFAYFVWFAVISPSK